MAVPSTPERSVSSPQLAHIAQEVRQILQPDNGDAAARDRDTTSAVVLDAGEGHPRALSVEQDGSVSLTPVVLPARLFTQGSLAGGAIMALTANGPVFETGSLPGPVKALSARHAALAGHDARLDSFSIDVLGLWRSGRWREAVSTALLGDWSAVLFESGRLDGCAVDHIKAEAQAIHRQLTPLWRRKSHHSRVLLMDTPLGDGLSLYDLVADNPDTHALPLSALPDNPRILDVLAHLTQVEQAVAMAWAKAQAISWTEAADDVLATNPALSAHPDPIALGERVRRKLKRLGARSAHRETATAVRKGGTR